MYLPLRIALTGALALAAACAPAARPGAARGAAPAGWTLTWGDEFDGPAGAPPDTTRWVHDTGGQGWGNQELQRYTTDSSNIAVDGQGHLVITARAIASGDAAGGRCWYGACRYTSARLKTQNRFTQSYGRFEARLRIPRGRGVWPAFWMLGADIPTVGWPASGEIDIMESVGHRPHAVHGTIHGPGHAGAAGIGGADTLVTGAWSDAFHVYTVEWEPERIRWLIDGRAWRLVTPADLPAGARWVYDHPFFLLLNLAIGGQWPGAPDATTVLPQRLEVDWVRVYQRQPERSRGSAG